MLVLSVIFLAIAVSFDAFAIGITYGMNRITISLWPKAVLSIVSGLFIFLQYALRAAVRTTVIPQTKRHNGGTDLHPLGTVQHLA